MTTLTPATARALWLALVDNAARLVVEADTLFPSPRAQSLVVLAQEEIGKAVWVYKAFSSAWANDDDGPREVPELREHGRRHIAKLMEATIFTTALVEVPGAAKPVDVELVREYAPEVFVACVEELARTGNREKQNGFYVDMEEGGTFTVPHAIERPHLRSHIWVAADMVKMLIEEDGLLLSAAGKAPAPTQGVEALIAGVLARGWVG